LARDLAGSGRRLAGDAEAARLFLRADGTPLAEGDLLRQPQLATVLSRLRSRGVDALVAGPVAEQIAGGLGLDVAALRQVRIDQRA
ncbi:gamma-glutamyltransferase, partial [Acinetobacter baumannii]